MGIFDFFSKRNNKSNHEVFTYNDIPVIFRVQVIHIWDDSIGPFQYRSHYQGPCLSNKIWKYIKDILCREYGLFDLNNRGSSYEQCKEFLLKEESVDRVLDIIEVSFRFIDVIVRENKNQWNDMGIKQKPDEAIEELNQRLQNHGLGYQYIKGKMVRVDSDYIFKEAVEPAVALLFNKGFEGASEEFMRAHEHFRKGNDKEAVTEALKAFESAMKTIIFRMQLDLPTKENANALIKTLIENELIPHWLENSLIGLANLRNKLTAHGQGEKTVKIPRHSVAYALHLCASNIVFLIESYNQKNNH